MEEGELAGAAELEAEEGDLDGPVQHAMDTENEGLLYVYPMDYY